MAKVSTTRKVSPKNKTTNGPPRPANSFMLFRSDYCQTRKFQGCVLQSDLSKGASVEWKALDTAQRLYWQRKAQEVAAQHKADHPDYKYQPRRETDERGYPIRRTRKLRFSSSSSSATESIASESDAGSVLNTHSPASHPAIISGSWGSTTPYGNLAPGSSFFPFSQFQYISPQHQNLPSQIHFSPPLNFAQPNPCSSPFYQAQPVPATHWPVLSYPHLPSSSPTHHMAHYYAVEPRVDPVPQLYDSQIPHVQWAPSSSPSPPQPQFGIDPRLTIQ